MARSLTDKNNQRGFTLLEMIATLVILSILSVSAIPIMRNTVKRQREYELRIALRELRGAIDRYRRFYEQFPNAIPIQERTESGYPRNLEILVEGFTPANMPTTKKIRFLRRIPIDPMTGTTDWGTRSYSDDPDSFGGLGDDVFDVYTKSEDIALDGKTRYRDW